jgi:hypothetical protein
MQFCSIFVLCVLYLILSVFLRIAEGSPSISGWNRMVSGQKFVTGSTVTNKLSLVSGCKNRLPTAALLSSVLVHMMEETPDL